MMDDIEIGNHVWTILDDKVVHGIIIAIDILAYRTNVEIFTLDNSDIG